MRRNKLKISSFAGYIGVFFLVIALVSIGYQPPEQIKAAASAVSTNTVASDAVDQQAISVDDLVATQVATTIAQSADLPVASNVANLSQSIAAESVLVQNDSNIVAKPQVVQASADTRQIVTYTAVAGDTVESIAQKYGLTAQTVKWANNLMSDAIEPGKQLKILPTDGILYKVKSGDTIESIAKKYNANTDQIRTYNDLDLSDLNVGSEIVVPQGELPEQERPGYVAPVTTYYSTIGNYSGGYSTSNTYGQTSGNRYGFGQCTWYAYERRLQLGRPVGGMWGNARSWASYAANAGYQVNGTPAVGTVMQNGGGWYGHVAIVESVNPGVSITISEMNARRFGGGFNRIGRGEISWAEATSGMYRYIY